MEKIVTHTAPEHNYHSKEVVSSACSEIFENILKKTYEEENPFRRCHEVSMSDNTSSEDTNLSAVSSDFAIIPRKSIKGSESRTKLETEGLKTAKSKYTNSSTVTQVHFLNQKVSNPFEKLLTANESFTYHKPHYSRMSENTIIEEEEIEEEYEGLDGLSASVDRIGARTNDAIQSVISCGVQKNANSGISDFVTGTFQQQLSIPNNLLINSQNTPRDNGNMHGQGDSNNVNENLLVNSDDYTSISVKVNFAFYAKLLAFLLTINTLIFFKTFILSNILNFWIR